MNTHTERQKQKYGKHDTRSNTQTHKHVISSRNLVKEIMVSHIQDNKALQFQGRGKSFLPIPLILVFGRQQICIPHPHTVCLNHTPIHAYILSFHTHTCIRIHKIIIKRNKKGHTHTYPYIHTCSCTQTRNLHVHTKKRKEKKKKETETKGESAQYQG